MKNSSEDTRDQILLDIGDIGVRIASENKDYPGKRFNGFLVDKENPVTFDLAVYENIKKHISRPFQVNPPKVYLENGRLFVERPDFIGCVDLNSFECKVRVSNEIAFESFLRVLYSLVLPNMKGVAIHASSLMKHGKSYVFPGKSGVGKTTIVRLSPDATLLTDEISIIRDIGKVPTAYGTPFHGDLGIPGTNVNAPVTGIYFPVKDKENYLEKISAKSALKMLLSNTIFFGQDQEMIEKIFNLSYDFISSLPCYNLHFLPDPSFWKCIDG